MAIPKHKCTALCDPDERIHVLPNLWKEGMLSPADWQRWLMAHEVLSVRREDDAVKASRILAQENPAWNNFRYHPVPEHYVGYLVTVRDLDNPHEGP